jgi:hypothetical protein
MIFLQIYKLKKNSYNYFKRLSFNFIADEIYYYNQEEMEFISFVIASNTIKWYLVLVY